MARRFSVVSYTPSIRSLLEVEAGEQARIVCKLIQVDLEQAPAFDALSYVWGSNTSRRKILCNGIDTAITQNLHSALKQLRLVEHPRMIWIDQLCINQDDIQERNSQVLLMCRIYRRAQGVVIWLGEEANDSDRAMDLLAYFTAAVKRLPSHNTYQSIDT